MPQPGGIILIIRAADTADHFFTIHYYLLLPPKIDIGILVKSEEVIVNK